ncbi:hypothetical protein [uncultured Eubacterium sp.]|uniref:hypothetical protein n=1 Tax=uncultured Eubacterium sp. TaxID=165185 RepID=UPI0025E1C500|nr:hypothetical protein [uncultured Eubacterium sp.]
MKRFIIILSVCVLLCTALYGCKSSPSKSENSDDNTVSSSQSQDLANGSDTSLAPGEEEDSEDGVAQNNNASSDGGASANSGGAAASKNGSSSSDSNSGDSQNSPSDNDKPPTVEYAHENDGEWGASINN